MLVHGEGDRDGKPFRLLPWQREFNWRWFELDPLATLGPWWYLEALILAERGAVKTEFLAALGMTEMAAPENLRGRAGTPLIHVAAASLAQAGELFRQVQIMAGGAKGQERSHAPLAGLFEVLDQTVMFADGRPGRIQRVAAEAGTNEGGKTSLFLADELAEWLGARARVWDVINAATTKRTPPGRSASISMPGRLKGATPPADDDPLLWKLFARGLLEAGDPESRYLFDYRPSSKIKDWSNAKQVEAALRAQRGADVTWSVAVRLREILTRKISPVTAQRLYLCQWPDQARGSWLDDLPGVWAECADEHAAPTDGDEVVVGVDMALHSDHVGIIVAGRLTDGRVGWWSKSFPPIDGRIDHADVFAFIAGTIATRWRIRSVVYDPRFFELPARYLEDQSIATVEFPQSPERLIPADELLRSMVAAHQVAHLDDPVLNAHCDNAAWRDSERGRFLAKGKAGGPMDLIRAGSMATWELVAGQTNAVSEPMFAFT